jgi:hypothetical protein
MKRTTKYVGLDVHQATIVASVRDDSGRILARSMAADSRPRTGAERVVRFGQVRQQLREAPHLRRGSEPVVGLRHRLGCDGEQPLYVLRPSLDRSDHQIWLLGGCSGVQGSWGRQGENHRCRQSVSTCSIHDVDQVSL